MTRCLRRRLRKLAKLRTIVVDDEPLSVRLLESMLTEFPAIEIVDTARNGRQAIRAVQDREPDLLILDIQMPGMTGFDVIKGLQADIMPLVIFCTAYERYAVEAFDLYAVDYLLKPINRRRLKIAVDRALARHSLERRPVEQKSALIGAIDEIGKRVAGSHDVDTAGAAAKTHAPADRKIAIKDGDNIIMVAINDIVWVEAAGDYMCVHANGATHIMRSTLKELMKKLESEIFKRIHRSTIVNLNHIDRVTPLPRGEYMIELDCGETLKVSRNYRSSIRTYLDAH
jgi:two-component system LytT family response regulator